MLIASNSEEFDQSIEGLSSLASFLNQYSVDGCASQPRERTAFGMAALEAHTNLFTFKGPKMEVEEINFPSHLDPAGRLMAEVRRRSFCYTVDNAVDYKEVAFQAEGFVTLLSSAV